MNKTLSSIDKELLKEIAGFHEIPNGSFSIRKDGEVFERNTTEDIDIISKTDKSGIDVVIKPNVKNKSVHIPVILTKSGLSETVYNDFYVGENCEVLIVAGCGIHNDGNQVSEHDGVHTFYIGKNSTVKYVEKHIGIGSENSQKILSPTTKIFMDKNSNFEMETVQLKGVSYSKRDTKAVLKENAKLVIKEKILTSSCEQAHTKFDVVLKGKKSSVEVISRSVAKDNSKQSFASKVTGQNECFAHVECDGIIANKGQILARPEIYAKNENANLVHEAQVGKIANEQLLKLETLGLTQKEAEDLIIKGFLR